MAKITHTDIKWSHMNSHCLLMGMHNGIASLEGSWVVPYKNRHTLSIGFNDHTPTFTQMSSKWYVSAKPFTWVFSAALFIIDKSWTMEYCSVLKTNKLSSHGKTWRIFKCILLSERSHFEMVTHYMIPTIWYLGKSKTIEKVKRQVVARASENGGRGEKDE